nr:hypothetical protein [Tanacetum cinerariifolium]
MKDEHLNTILATESDEFIKSCIDNLVPNPSESKGENGCDVLAGFTTFPNVLFDDDYDSDSKSLPNHDSSVIISSKINSLFDEFAGELTLLISFPPGIDEHDCHPEKEIRLIKRLLYDNSSPRPPKDFSRDDVLPSPDNEDKPSAECPMIINGKNIPLLDVPLFYFYPLDQLNIPENMKTLAKGFCTQVIISSV